MSNIVVCSFVVVSVSLFLLRAEACTLGRNAGASAESVFKSSKNFVLAEVVSTVEMLSDVGEGTQISKLKVIKDYREKSPHFLNVLTHTSKKQTKEFGTLRCGLSYRFSTGEMVLFSPNFLLPSAFVPVKGLSEADRKVSVLVESSKDPSVRSLDLFLDVNDLEKVQTKLSKTLDVCESVKGCNESELVEFISFEDYLKLRSGSSPEANDLIFRLLSTSAVYAIAEQRGMEEKLLNLGVASLRDISKKYAGTKSSKAKVFYGNLKRIFQKYKYSFVVDGKPVATDSIFK